MTRELAPAHQQELRPDLKPAGRRAAARLAVQANLSLGRATTQEILETAGFTSQPLPPPTRIDRLRRFLRIGSRNSG